MVCLVPNECRGGEAAAFRAALRAQRGFEGKGSVALSPLLSPVPSSHVPSKHYTAPGPEETQPEGTQRPSSCHTGPPAYVESSLRGTHQKPFPSSFLLPLHCPPKAKHGRATKPHHTVHRLWCTSEEAVQVILWSFGAYRSSPHRFFLLSFLAVKLFPSLTPTRPILLVLPSPASGATTVKVEGCSPRQAVEGS